MSACKHPRRKSERGATAIEYGLIASLVCIIMLVGLTPFSKATTDMFNTIAAKFPSR